MTKINNTANMGLGKYLSFRRVIVCETFQQRLITTCIQYVTRRRENCIQCSFIL